MSVIPEEWGELDSTAGLFYELGWLLLVIVLFGSFLIFQPLFIEIEITPAPVVGSVILGIILGITLVISTVNDRARQFWKRDRYRFASIFVLAMLIQVVLRLVPTWTLLTGIVASVVTIPGRIAIYLRAQTP
ncbi:hypothetical protein [Halococcus agarilyticus]|uniref:hypothetical protein n=1 Tax=Halococcus agarilyticus TaxID=1232219 RepID=UPI000677CACD|nr:hypothetical protein [Halococcus agarilyticus]